MNPKALVSPWLTLGSHSGVSASSRDPEGEEALSLSGDGGWTLGRPSPLWTARTRGGAAGPLGQDSSGLGSSYTTFLEGKLGDHHSSPSLPGTRDGAKAQMPPRQWFPQGQEVTNNTSPTPQEWSSILVQPSVFPSISHLPQPSNSLWPRHPHRPGRASLQMSRGHRQEGMKWEDPA